MLVPVFILQIDKCLKGKTEVLQRLTLSCSIRDREVSFHFGAYTILACSRLSVSENDFEKKERAKEKRAGAVFNSLHADREPGRGTHLPYNGEGCWPTGATSLISI